MTKLIFAFLLLTIIMGRKTKGEEEKGGCYTDIMAGTVEIQMNGKNQDNYLAVSGGTKYNNVYSNSSTVVLGHGTRAYFANKCVNSFASDMFTWFQLLGKTIEFTVDLSAVGCGCNAAFYLLSMPACSPSQAGDYYCDANDVGGEWCPEIDLMEANNAAFQSTPHICYNQYSWCGWSSCDKGGEGYNFRSNYKQIDINRAITVATSFIVDGSGNLKEMKTVISQGSNNIQHSNTDSNYLSQLTGPMKQGMVATFSFWGNAGGDMAWLDVPPCNVGTSCDGSKTVPFSNFKVY